MRSKDGGQLPKKKNRTSVKFASETRGCFGVAMTKKIMKV